MKIRFILGFILVFTSAGYAQYPQYQGRLKELFAGPAPSEHDAWLREMRQWRMAEREKLNYNDSEYLRPEFEWLKNTFIYVQMMAHDRYFYDVATGKYTVDRFLDDLKERYGGIDAVLIWPTYPNIGIDNRNQFDLLHDMPGGVNEIKQMIVDFKKRGVRVFFPIMYWDHGTREIDSSMPAALISEMKEIGADGLNGDTMSGVTEDFKDAYDSLHYPVVLQPEVGVRTDLKMIQWNTSSWGYYWDYTFEPGVSICKWLEPQHQVFVTNRWAVDKTDDLQYAFFNGIGYNAWENMWGVWNQIPDRYEKEIRMIATIYRAFPGIWNSQEWEPFVPTLQDGVFASKFPGLDETVYTLVNRDSTDANGRQLQLPDEEGMKYYDLWNGKELTPKKSDDHIELSFPIEGLGFGALVAVKSYAVDGFFQQVLSKMNTLSEKPLKSYSTAWQPLPQQMVAINKTKSAVKTPKGMVLIPGTKEYDFNSVGVMIEGDPLPDAVGVQHPWEQHPSRSQEHVMSVPSFYIDKYPVTNKQFKQFLDVTHYHPKDDHNFLRDWMNGNYPKGWENKPVTWVSIEDARAYAFWTGKRLPHEWEWQYAAQGTDNRRYPWGNEMDADRIPPPDSTREMRPPTDVKAYPQGASPFGVVDMTGNVWQWTDEYIDEHTRSAVLKGGGYYRATTSKWYFPRVSELNQYGKYLLMAPSLDRSGAIGFRCVVDK